MLEVITTSFDVVASAGPEDAALIARMRAALEFPRLESSQRIRVQLALGKAADDLGDYEQAMRHFDSAETLRNSLIRFDLGKFEARVDASDRAFHARVVIARARERLR